MVKNLPAMRKIRIPSLGQDLQVRKIPGERNGNSLQYSCLENPMDGGAWRAAVHGVAKSRTRLSGQACMQSAGLACFRPDDRGRVHIRDEEARGGSWKAWEAQVTAQWQGCGEAQRVPQARLRTRS